MRTLFTGTCLVMLQQTNIKQYIIAFKPVFQVYRTNEMAPCGKYSVNDKSTRSKPISNLSLPAHYPG